MSKRAMFWRMVASSVLRRRSRVLIAVLAVAIGATTLSGLATIAIDVPAQMAREIRSYGANIVVTGADGQAMDDEALAAVDRALPAAQLVGSASFDYETVTVNDQPYVAGGTDLEAVRQMSPFWFVDGEWPSGGAQVLLGEEIAATIDAKTGDRITINQLDGTASSNAAAASGSATSGSGKANSSGATPAASGPGSQAGAQSASTPLSAQTAQASQGAQSGADGQARSITVTVSGILKTGGNEDGYIYMSADDMAELTGAWEPSIAQYSVALEGDQLTELVDSINASVTSVRAQTVKRLVQSDSGVIDMLRSLLGLITVIVLALTTIGVSTTMIAVVTERRNEIGLRKALGATSRSIMGEFMGEGVALGAIGGLVGAAAGYALAAAISWNVFHRAVAVHPLVLIATVVSSVAVAVVACLPPVRRALAIDPALVLRGE
ncbi:MAG: ABC transporter permease [Schaalia georgiae]|uniref:ABC transporter permease n=1 Tax=Schaalia georgiae TaxID=52768 RepID=A0A929QYD2_9ACTO|nr:ABC transporter permease [Schaalia georgiae]